MLFQPQPTILDSKKAACTLLRYSAILCKYQVQPHLPGIHVASDFYSDYVCMLSEDLVDDRVVKFSFCIFMKGKLYYVPQMQLCACHRMSFELLNIWHDVAEVINGPVRCASLGRTRGSSQQTACGRKALRLTGLHASVSIAKFHAKLRKPYGERSPDLRRE